MDRLEFTRYGIEPDGVTYTRELSIFMPVPETDPGARLLPDFEGFWRLIAIVYPLSDFDFLADLGATEPGVPLWEGPVADTHLRPGVVIITREQYIAGVENIQEQQQKRRLDWYMSGTPQRDALRVKLVSLGLTAEEAARLAR